jgi:hypothetical protein
MDEACDLSGPLDVLVLPCRDNCAQELFSKGRLVQCPERYEFLIICPHIVQWLEPIFVWPPTDYLGSKRVMLKYAYA